MNVFGWMGLGLFFCLSLNSVLAQPPKDDEHKAPQSIGNNFIETPLKRPKINTAMAKVSFPLSNITEKTEEAQKFFDQGIAAIHGFWTFEAERNFLEAARLMPNHPLPYAFAAYAQVVFKSGDPVRAQRYLQLAIEKRKDAGLKLKWDEIRWLEAIQHFFNNRNPEDQHKLFIESLTEMVKRNEHPDIVLETKAFLALAIWEYKLKPLKATDYADEKKMIEINKLREEADRYIEDVLNAPNNAKHPVHHYKIHLMNRGKDNILARNSALRCGRDNPGCAHLWHMPAHTFSSLKEFRRAAYQLEAALRVDNAYLAALGVDGSVIHNYAHNLDYLLDVLGSCGGIDRALEIARHAIQGPSFLEAAYAELDPVDWSVRQMTEVMEEHMLWKEADEWIKQGIFSTHHFNRKEDVLYKANYYRFLGLVQAKMNRTEEAKNSLVALQRLREEYALKVEPEALKTLQNIERDLSLWIHISDTDNPLEITDETIKSFEAAGVTPLHLIAWQVGEQGDSHEAEAIAKRAADKAPGEVMPLSVYVYLLVRNNKEEASRRKWNELKTLIHLPVKADTVETKYSIAGAYPFLEKIQQAFWRSTWHTQKDKDEFYLVEKTVQPTLKTWEKHNGTEVMKGPLLLPYASRFVQDELTIWSQLQGMVTDKYKEYFEKGIPNGKKLLVVFRLAEDCEACNVEQAKVEKEWAAKYNDQGIEIVFVSAGKDLPKVEKGPVSLVMDPELKLFKIYGAFNEFEEKPEKQAVHGVFLIDSNRKVIWRRTTGHAFKEWGKLLKEAVRLNGINPKK